MVHILRPAFFAAGSCLLWDKRHSAAPTAGSCFRIYMKRDKMHIHINAHTRRGLYPHTVFDFTIRQCWQCATKWTWRLQHTYFYVHYLRSSFYMETLLPQPTTAAVLAIPSLPLPLPLPIDWGITKFVLMMSSLKVKEPSQSQEMITETRSK